MSDLRLLTEFEDIINSEDFTDKAITFPYFAIADLSQMIEQLPDPFKQKGAVALFNSASYNIIVKSKPASAQLVLKEALDLAREQGELGFEFEPLTVAHEIAVNTIAEAFALGNCVPNDREPTITLMANHGIYQKRPAVNEGQAFAVA